MSNTNKQLSPDVQIQELLPVHFLLHVGGVAAAVVGQQEATIAQPVDIYLNVGAVHHDDISCWGLASHLQAAVEIINWLKKRQEVESNKEHVAEIKQIP